MPNFNPFSSNDEDTSFERGTPAGQVVKTVTKAVSDQTKIQTKAFQDDLNALLFGPSTPPDQDGASKDPAKAQINASQTNVSQAVAGSQANATNSGNPNLSPEEQAKMAKIRNELSGNYRNKLGLIQNGVQNINTNLEQEMEKARKEREQKEAQRKQEEEAEEQRKKEEEEARKHELVSPAGKKTGFMMGKKQQQPMAVHLAKIKTEGNRGASG